MQNADVGFTLHLEVTATSLAGSGIAITADTAVVQAIPINTVLPEITGQPFVGQQLQTSNGTWNGGTTGFAYQWRRCDAAGANCVDIAGATNQNYTLVGADATKTIRAVVTASNAAGTGPPATSNQTAVVNGVPVASVQPSISGNAFVGQTLTANNGTWSGTPTFTYQWRRCDSAGANCNDIVPFTAQTYQVQGADSGMTLRVVVTATNGAGSANATSAQTGIVNAAPGNTALPTISGTKAQGQQLTATQGTWSNNPSSFAYQWQRCDSGGANCADIATATTSTYTLVAGDVGSTIRVKVTATNPSGSSSATSDPTAVIVTVPANTVLPTITGTVQQGQTLTAGNGTWSNSPTFTYQWRQCDSGGANCTNIGGATSQTYVPQAADVGKTLRVVVTATNAAGSASATSDQTVVVQANVPGTTFGKTTIGALTHALGGNYLEASGRYTLASSSSVTKLSAYLQGGGSATSVRAVIYTDSSSQPSAFVAVSQAVTIAAGQAAGWVDFPVSGSPALPAGQYWLGLWASNTSALGYYDNSSNSGRYAPSTFSAGSNPPASWPGGGSFDSLSYSLYATLGTPPSAPANTVLPAISGTATQGQVLSSTTGTWSNSPTGFAYQWRRCDSGGTGCADIAGATNSTYTLVAADVSGTVRVVVTATNAGGSAAATSTQTAAVASAPVPGNTGLPVISGTPTEGQALNTTNGTWTNTPTSFAYQWQRCDNAGANCTNIAGATNSAYTLVSADVAKTLRAIVTATNASGSTPATSAQSAVVQALPTTSFGKTSVGALTHALGGNYLEASGRYTLASSSSVTKLSAYLQGGGSATSMRAVIYTDSSSQPSAFVAVSQAVTIAAGQAAGWVDFPVSGSPTLPAGQYWLGLWASNTSALGYYDNSSNSGRYAPSTFSAGSNPPASWPGGGSFDDLSYSLYATLGAPPSAPANTILPAISGTATQGQVLNSTTGTWSNSPTGFAYQWRRCNSGGTGCADIAGATNSTYTLVAADVTNTIRVVVTATNAGGSAAATSTQTAAVASAPVPGNTGLPVISGTTYRGPGAEHDERDLDEHPDQLRLPVAALRQRGRELREHRRRDQLGVHAGLRRCRLRRCGRS